MSYKKCSSKIMEETMKEFEKKQLKLRNDKPVKDRKQAVAIGLSESERKCHYSKEEMQHVKSLVDTFLMNDERKISEDRIPLSNVIQTKHLINNFIEKKKYKEAYKYLSMLTSRTMDATLHNIPLTKNIIKELKDLPGIN
jgi:hypothetical protein